MRSTLEVESGTNDPMAIFLTLALVELLASGEGYGGINLAMLGAFIQQMGGRFALLIMTMLTYINTQSR